MDAKDLIYDTIYKKSLAAGSSERAAKDYAVMGLDLWKKGKFKKATQLVDEMIAAAKKYKQK